MNLCGVKDVQSMGHVRENWSVKGILLHRREFTLAKNKTLICNVIDKTKKSGGVFL